MKVETRQTEFEFFDRYRVTHHIGSGLIEIEVYDCVKTILSGKKWFWKRIYFGHSNPIESALEFYQKSRKEEQNQA